MTQLLLPIISPGVTQINPMVSVWESDERWTYFLGKFPIYSHRVDDQRMFRLTIAQLIESGACRQTEVINAFGVSKSSVIRAQNKLRNGGSEAFFIDRRGRKGGTVFTPKILDQAQSLLDKGLPRKEIAEELGVKHDTLRKAINDGRLKEKECLESTTNKSTRTVVDAAAADGMGTACTRVEERTFAAFGVCEGAPVRFESCFDVPKGVFCALYRHCWPMGCWRALNSSLALLRDTIQSFISFCCLRSWLFAGSKRWKRYGSMHQGNLANCWVWTVFPKCAV